MKGIVLSLVISVMLASVAFGRGVNDNTIDGRGTGLNRSGELTAVSGEIKDLDGRVVIQTADGLYSLSAPGIRRNPVEIPYGQTAQLEGYLVDAPSDDCEIDADGHLFVESAIVNGETLSFNAGARRGGREGSNGAGLGNGNARTGRGQAAGAGNRWNESGTRTPGTGRRAFNS